MAEAATTTTTAAMNRTLFDVIIIGGGPAGLAVATGLARQLYTAVVFDSGVYRNARTRHMHNVPTWDHRDPAEFRAKARADLLARYGATLRFEDVAVSSVRSGEKAGGGGGGGSRVLLFRATDARGREWAARKLVLATGVRDVVPDDGLDGYDDVWARGVYHCLFCHGFEDRGAAGAGVLAVGGDMANVFAALHQARMAARLVHAKGKVTVYTDGADELADQIAAHLASGAGVGAGDAKIRTDRRRIVRLEKGAGGESQVIVHFDDKTTATEGFIVHKPKSELNGPFARQLSLELTEHGVIKTTQPFYETSNLHGVFAVGDCASPMPAVTNALAMGAFCAAGLVSQLQTEAPPVVEGEEVE